MSESTGPHHDSIEEQLILAREVGRGIPPPPFDGFTVDLQGQRVNLWWRDRHLRSRDFSDAFVTRQNQLVLVVASVSDPLDPTGLALSIRAFLRARLSSASDKTTVIAELEEWAENDPQWAGCCHLGIAILEPNRELVYARYGNVSLSHRGVGGEEADVDFPATLPLLFGAYRESEPVECHKLTLEPGEAFMINSEDVSAAADRNSGDRPPSASAGVTARELSMAEDRESLVQDEIDQTRERLKAPIRRHVERTFSGLLDVLMERARRDGDEKEIDRLISHGVAVQQQWIPLAIRDDLIITWKKELDPDGQTFLRRYNLFVDRGIDKHCPDRWQKLWVQYIRLTSLNHRITEWGEVKCEEVNPLLKRARRDDPATGQFARLDEDTYRRIDRIYDKLEDLTREFHATLIHGLKMQQEWMDEWSYDEPGPELDSDSGPRPSAGDAAE